MEEVEVREGSCCIGDISDIRKRTKKGLVGSLTQKGKYLFMSRLPLPTHLFC